MFKRIILCSLVFCLLLVLSCCGRSVDTLTDLNSISNTFLNVYYSATVSEADDYAKLNTEIENARPSIVPGKDMYSLEDFAPDLEKRFEAQFKHKYQTQPLTDKCMEKIITYGTTVELWKAVLKTGSDIKVTSVKTSLRNTGIDEKENDIDYTVDLLINNTSYEVTGVLALTLADGKWQINDINEFNWSPSPAELLTNK